MESSAKVTDPLSFGHHSSQWWVALDMAGVDFAAIADENGVSFSSVFAVIANPVHHFLRILLVFHLPGLDQEFFSFEPEGPYSGSAEGALVGCFKPLLQALEAKLMLAFQLATFFYLF
jgi:hypothetical protein